MNIGRPLALGLGLALALAASTTDASAQNRQLVLTNWGNSGTINTTEYGTVRSSPYQGYFAGDPTNPLIDFFCIDFEHYAPPLGYQMNVFVTDLGTGDISNTRQASVSGSLAKYRQIAWLIAQRGTVDSTNWRAIQLAVWQTFSGSCADTSRPSFACARNADVGLNALADGWRTSATTAAAGMAANEFGAFRIVTGVGADGVRQEYMYVTPEPETYALMGTGLIALLFAWRRRRRRDDDPAFASSLAGF